MRQTITPCLIQKKSDHFLVKFTEYPDCELKCCNLEDCLDVAPVFLASYLLSIDEEFKPHTKPLTPKTDNKDQIFTLVKCDMDEMENVLIDFKVSAQEFVNWLSGRTDELQLPAPDEPEKDINKEKTEVLDPAKEEELPAAEKEVINNEPKTNDAADEFDILFNSSSETPPQKDTSSTDVASNEPTSESKETEKEPVQATQPEASGRNDFRQHRNNRNRPEHKPAPVKDDEPDKTSSTSEPVAEPVEPQKPAEDSKTKDESAVKEPDGLKDKVKDMNYEKHNNAGVFGVIEEEELEFVSKPNNKPKEKTPASTPNRHQQNFNKKNNKHYPKKKKGNNNNTNNSENKQPS